MQSEVRYDGSGGELESESQKARRINKLSFAFIVEYYVDIYRSWRFFCIRIGQMDIGNVVQGHLEKRERGQHITKMDD